MLDLLLHLSLHDNSWQSEMGMKISWGNYKVFINKTITHCFDAETFPSTTFAKLKEDSESLSDILESMIERRPQLTNVKRLGKYDLDKVKETPNICRPILVTFANRWNKRLLLSFFVEVEMKREQSTHIVRSRIPRTQTRTRVTERTLSPHNWGRNCFRILISRCNKKVKRENGKTFD